MVRYEVKACPELEGARDFELETDGKFNKEHQLVHRVSDVWERVAVRLKYAIAMAAAESLDMLPCEAKISVRVERGTGEVRGTLRCWTDLYVEPTRKLIAFLEETVEELASTWPSASFEFTYTQTAKLKSVTRD